MPKYIDFSPFDFGLGEITWKLNHFTEDDQDLLFVRYPNECMLSVDYFGKETGFQIMLTKEQSRTPVAIYRSKTKEGILSALNHAIKRATQESICNTPYYGELWETEIYTL